jgi:hypothetical protein
MAKEGNPFDQTTLSPIGGSKTMAVIVDDDDPKKLGRVKIRMAQQHPDLVQEEKLPWVSVLGSTENANFIGGVGKTPRLLKGSVVTIEYIGEQNPVVTGSLPRALPADDPESTIAPERVQGSSKRKGVGDSKWWESWWQRISNNAAPYDVPTNKTRDPGQWQPEKGDPVDNIRKQAKPSRWLLPSGLGLKSAKSGRNSHTPLPITGFSKLDGDMLNTPKFIQETIGKPGELIKGSTDMVLQLQKATQSGGIHSAVGAMGGIGAISQAIASVSNIVKNNAGQNSNQGKKEEESLLEMLLRLYKEETGQNGRNSNGTLTPQFIAWRDEYLEDNQGLV